ncbi:class I SAM-dependent methyltransferase [Endozoicomonas montiporae]|nr:class I SAM-dependent methyltransferase [Endozoicomonas montiporae]
MESNKLSNNVVSEKDYSLHSGERQTGIALEDIRLDHTVRYELAKKVIKEYFGDKQISAIDVFCGNGYGVYSLANDIKNLHITGIDGSQEAIDSANKYYSLPNTLFSYKLFPFKLPENIFDVVICFESLEHVEDDRLMLDNIFCSLKVGGLLLVSIPNQNIHPLEKNPHHFHFRHYKNSDFLKLLPNEFKVKKTYGQNVYKFSSSGVNTFELLQSKDMELIPGVEGQVNIYLLQKVALNDT